MKKLELIDGYKIATTALDTNILTAGYIPNNVQFTATTNWETLTVQLNVERFKSGSNLVMENGKIKIGKGIKKVICSANLLVSGTGTGEVGIFLMKNNTPVVSTFVIKTSSGIWEPLILSPIGVDVVEGDYIELRLYIGAANNTFVVDGSDGTRTWLTVEAVG